VLRELGPGDGEHVKWTLWEAVSWNPARELPPYEVVVEHPEPARYHRGWGRRGDVGVAAEFGDEVVGVAFFRLFTAEDHGHGYIDDATPELAIAVRDGLPGNGLGDAADDRPRRARESCGKDEAVPRAETEKPAARLHESLGYREVSRDDTDGIRMVLHL